MIKVLFKYSGGTKRTGKKRLEVLLYFMLGLRKCSFEKVLADFKPPLLKLVWDHYRFVIHILNTVLPEARNTSWPETTSNFWSPAVCNTDTHSFKHIIHFHNCWTFQAQDKHFILISLPLIFWAGFIQNIFKDIAKSQSNKQKPKQKRRWITNVLVVATVLYILIVCFSSSYMHACVWQYIESFASI